MIKGLDKELCPDYDLALHIAKTEYIRKSVPSKKDYRETKDMLKDFGVKVKVPEFETVAELLRWRKQTIEKML